MALESTDEEAVHAAELQAVLHAEPALLDRLAGDVGAVGGAEVGKEDAVARVFEAGVALRDGGVVDDDVVSGGAAEVGEAGADGEGLDLGAEGDAEVGVGRRELDRLGDAFVGAVVFLVADAGGLAEALPCSPCSMVRRCDVSPTRNSVCGSGRLISATAASMPERRPNCASTIWPSTRLMRAGAGTFVM